MGTVADVVGQLCRERGLAGPRRLGGGGFAEVFVAAPADATSADAVAIKVGHLPLGNSAVYREQFTNECAALYELREAEHVVRYLDAGVRDGHPYLITEYCAASLAVPGPVPLHEVIRHGIGMAKGLLAVHAAGFVHGDVTPQNALVRGDDTVVLADFGLARPIGDDHPPTLGFDPAHAAPETVRDGVVDVRSDVYGLGSTLFTLVTGSIPGRADRRRALRRAMRNGPHGRASGPAIDRLAETIASMLAEEPAARPELVTVIDALAAARRDGAFHAAGPRRLPSRPAVRIGIVAAALVVGAGIAAAVLIRPAPIAGADLHCLPDATAFALGNHHSHQPLVLADAIAGPGSTFIARRAEAAAPCGERLAVTGGVQQPGCLAVHGPDVVVAPCRDDAAQVWLLENHTFLDGVLWQRLHPASDPGQCLQPRGGDLAAPLVAQLAECGTDWHQQWDLREVTDAVAGEPAVPPVGQACSGSSRLPLVDGTGSATGAPDVSVRACTTVDGDGHRAQLVASAAQPVAGAVLAWRIELHSCRAGTGRTARDYAPPQQFGGGTLFTSTTVRVPDGVPADTFTANGRVGWAIVTDAAGRRWHVGSMPDPIGTTCGAPPVAAPDRSGTVTDLEPQEGYDFDLGDRGGPESRPGLDISAESASYVFDSVATTEGGRLKRLPPRPEPYDRGDCATAPGEWTSKVPGVPVGGAICVVTDEGNTAVLTITKAWTGPGPAERTVGFTYRFWHGR